MCKEQPVRLNVRPFAHTDETVMGYLLRLGAVNGIRKSAHIIELTRLKGKTKLIALNRLHSGALLDATACSTGRSDLTLKMVQELEEQRFPVVQDAAIKSTRITQPRICLQCMHEGKQHLPWYWQSTLVSHCPTHGMKLISECPNDECGRALTWEPIILEACPHCKTRWDEIDMNGLELITPSTDLERKVVLHLKDNNAPDPAFCEDLTWGIMLVARSFDYMNDSLPEMPGSPNISAIINAAYWLIASVDFGTFYKNEKYSSLGKICIFSNQEIPSLNFYEFKSKTAKDAYDSEEINLKDHLSMLQFNDDEFINKKRKKHYKSARFHMDFHATMKTLGGFPDTVSTMREENTLPSLNDTRADKHIIFSASDLIDKISGILSDKARSDYIKIHPWSVALPQHCNNYARVLSWVLSGELKGYMQSSSGIDTLYVEPLPFTVMSRRHLAYVCNEPVSIQTAESILGLDEEEIRSAVRQGSLHFARYSRCNNLLDGPKLYRYAVSKQVQKGASKRRKKLTSLHDRWVA